MITASVKKRENIAEYLLYMWQIEDMIRANGMDIEKIRTGIIDKFTSLSPEQKKEMTEWYESLIDMMRREGVAESGHLQINKNVLASLADLNHRLLADPEFVRYGAQYYKVLPYIVEIRSRAGENRKGELESLFEMFYGIMLLRLQGKEVSEDTMAAAKEASALLAMLAAYYKKDQENTLFKDQREN